jgi:hypothetical protein
VWITMLAMADKHGIVISSLPGLSDMARVSIEGTLAALEKLASPDKWSSTQEHEGRRVEKIDRGWRLLNYVKFRDMRDEVERNEYMKNLMRERRAKEKAAKAVSQPVSTVSDRKHPLANASAKMIQILAMPDTRANKEVIAAGIVAESQDTGSSLEEASQSIANHAMRARKSGVPVDKFWFEDTKWRNGNGTKRQTSAVHDRVNGNREVLADLAAAFIDQRVGPNGDQLKDSSGAAIKRGVRTSAG